MSKCICMCAHCGKEFNPSPRVKNQRYCGNTACQKARRAAWQRRKLKEDRDYRDNQKRCQREWQKHNSGYYRSYRESHPAYTKRNLALQGMRDMRRRRKNEGKMLAKMDSLLKPYYSRRGSVFRLIPQDKRLLAKMDSIEVKLVPVQEVSCRL